MKRGYSRTFAASLIATLMSVGLAGLARAQDTSAPTVGAITPATATINVSTAFSATYTDDVGVTSCNLWLDGADQGAMTLSGTTSGTATKSVTIATSGAHTLQAKCKDAENNEGTGASTSVTVSAATGTAPTVGAVTPTTSAADAVTTYSASYTDNAGVTSCALYVDGASQGTMTLSSPNGTSGTATKSHIFTAAGTKTLQVRCLDADDNEGLGAETTVTVTSGSNAGAPTVGAISPTAATVNTATTLSVTYSDTDNVSSCNLWIGGADQGAMTLSGATSGTATKSHTFTTTGALTAQAKCKDAANNEGMGALATITVSAAGSDTAAPSAPTALALSTNTCDGTPTLTWTASTDNVAVTGYELKLDSGAFLNIGNVTTWTASATLTDGSHTVTLRALDAAGNVSAVTTQTFSIDADAESCPEQQPTTCATGEVLI